MALEPSIRGAQRSRQFLHFRRTVRTMPGALVDAREAAGIIALEFRRIGLEVFTPWRKHRA